MRRLIVSMLAFVLVSATHAQSPVNVSCDTAAFRTAVNNANASPAAAQINLAADCTYTLSSALTVNAPLTITGGANTVIRKAESAVMIHLLQIAPNIPLTLNGLRMERGSVLVDEGATLTASHIIIDGGSDPPALFAVFNGGGAVNLSDSTLTGTNGHALYNAGNATLTRVNIHDNVSTATAVVTNAGSLTITDSTLSNNSGLEGGHIRNTGTLVINRSRLSGGTTASGATAIYGVSGSVRIERSTVHDNGTRRAIIMLNGTTFTARNSTFSGNRGGAIRLHGTGTIFQSTFHDNRADQGAAIHATGSLDMRRATIIDNRATVSGGGVYIGSVTPFIQNTIIAGNTAPIFADIGSDSPLSGGYNLIESPDALTGYLDTTNILGQSARLLPFDDYGGGLFTRPPAIYSPALDAGFCDSTPTDQRGLPRRVDLPEYPNRHTGCDIGATERQSLPAFTCPDGTAGDDTLLCQVSLPHESNDDEIIAGRGGDDIITILSGVRVGGVRAQGHPDDVAGNNALLVYGDVYGDISGGAGNDYIAVHGVVTGAIISGGGDNTVTVYHTATNPEGTFTISGGDGDNRLYFDFSNAPATANPSAIIAQMTTPDGSFTYNGRLYQWAGFDVVRPVRTLRINERQLYNAALPHMAGTPLEFLLFDFERGGIAITARLTDQSVVTLNARPRIGGDFVVWEYIDISGTAAAVATVREFLPNVLIHALNDALFVPDAPSQIVLSLILTENALAIQTGF